MLKTAKRLVCGILAFAVCGCMSKEKYREDPVKTSFANLFVIAVAIPVFPVLAVASRVNRIGDTPYTKDMAGMKAFEKDFAPGQYYVTDIVKCDQPFSKVDKSEYYIFTGNNLYKRCFVKGRQCYNERYIKQGKNIFWMNYKEQYDKVGQFVSGSKGSSYNVFEFYSEGMSKDQSSPSYVLVAKWSPGCYKYALIRASDANHE
jgi:hypothetical protein